jgi:hypothetical protein
LDEAQQAGRDVKLAAVVGGEADGLFVEAQHHAFQHPAFRGMEADPVALGEAGHQRGGAGLGYELEPFNNQPIEKEQILFFRSLDRLDSGNAVGDLDAAGFHDCASFFSALSSGINSGTSSWMMLHSV